MTPPPRRVRALSIHAGYACQNSGVCCSSGWDVPVEPEVERHLRNALSVGTLRVPEGMCFRPVAGLPHGARVVFRTDASGRCVFLDADRRCAVHRQLGPDSLAAACRGFPRVVTLTPLGVSVTLSHYCPTATAMLFDALAVSILEAPPGFPPSWPYEGLDARDALPPLLRPGVLMDWPSLERWERFAVSVLADQGRSPEAALDVLASAAEQARRWTPDDGPFTEHFERLMEKTPAGERGAFREALRDEPRYPRDPAGRGSRGWQLVASCVPHRALLPPAPEGLGEADERWVAAVWPSLALPVRRWLAAKAFASWVALQGEGLRTTVLGLRVSLGVLRAEAARGCAEAGRALDADLLREAIRCADLLLVHLADPEALARRLSRCESSRP